MAFDHTPPDTNRILFYSVLSVVTLIVLRFVLDSYFSEETQSYYNKAVLQMDLPRSDRRVGQELREYKAEQEKKLTSGTMPISRALVFYAAQGRNASPELAAQPSNDLGPLQGWSELPNKVEVAQEPANAAAPSGTPETAPAPGAQPPPATTKP